MVINKRQKKVNIKKIIKIMIPIAIIIIVLIIISINNKKKNEQNRIEQIKAYTTVEDFKTIEEVAIYMDCKYIKEENSKTEGFKKDIYLTIKLEPYIGTTSNQQFYERLFTYCAKVVDYENFIIVDKTNNLVISVICSKDNKVITKYYINGDENYFQNQTSKLSIQNYTEETTTNAEIVAEEVTKLINSNWKVLDNTFGTKESRYNNYDIYFDEGISVRKVDGKIYNIVFNKKYAKEIIKDINTQTTLKSVQEILGTPQFKDEIRKIIGYKTKDVYIFFTEDEISIYRVEKNYDTTKFAELVEQYNSNKDLKQLITNLQKTWTDYDSYKYDSNYVYIQYSLKGVSIKYNYNNNNGIYIYTNYTGNLDATTTLEQVIKNEKQVPTNIIINNKNLVMETEINRIITEKNIIYDSENVIKNESNVFTININKINSNSYEIKFISKTGEYPNCELREYANYAIWLDDYNIIYSVTGKGIYKYNVKEKQYTTIVTGKDEFKIISINNGVLKYDETQVNI